MSFLKVHLFNESVGQLTCEEDPIGLDSFEQILERSDKNDGVMYQYSTQLQFIGTGRWFIRQCYETEGVQSKIFVYIHEYNPNTYKWGIIGTGLIKLINYTIDEIALRTNIDQIGFNIDFINLMEQDVDIETLISKSGAVIPATSVIDLRLQPKTILKEFKGSPLDENVLIEVSVNPVCTTPIYIQADNSDETRTELEDTFSFGNSFSVSSLISEFELYNAKEAGTLDIHAQQILRFGIALDTSIGLGDTITFQIHLYIVQRDKNDTILNTWTLAPYWEIVVIPGLLDIDSNYVIFEDTETAILDELGITVTKGDKFTFYGLLEQTAATGSTATNFAVLRIKTTDKENTFIDFLQATTFPETRSRSVLIYELCEKLCQFYTNQTDCFRSSVLGRTDTTPVYDEDGDAALLAATNGNNIRIKPDNNKLFYNFKDVMDSIASAFCLSWGFETVADGSTYGKPIVRIEKKSYFFDKSNEILDLGEVPGVTKKVSAKYYYQQINIGYPELKNIKQINGIDEFNTSRQYAPPITVVNNKLDLISKLRASGFEIETERRFSVETKDSDLDDERFMICVLRDTGEWKNERDENFPTITGLFDPSTSYNLNIAPERNARRWGAIFASNVIKGLDKIIAFSSGKGNYQMTSKRTDELLAISGSDNIDLTDTQAQYFCEEYNFEWFLTQDQWAAVKANPYGYIKFKDKGVNCKGYVLKIPHTPFSKKTNFTLLKVFDI